MALQIFCPGCNERLRLKDDAAGRNIQCPKCGVRFDVASTKASADDLQGIESSDPATFGNPDDVAASQSPSVDDPSFDFGVDLSQHNKPFSTGNISPPDAFQFAGQASETPPRTTSQNHGDAQGNSNRLPPEIDRKILISAGLVAGGLFGFFCSVMLYFVLRPMFLSTAGNIQPAESTETRITDAVDPEPLTKVVVKSNPPVFKSFPTGHSMDLYEDPPQTKYPNLSEAEYAKLAAKLVNTDWIEVIAPEGQPCVLFPFLRMDLKEDNRKYYWSVESTEPIVFRGSPRGSHTSGNLRVSVLPNLYVDAKTSTEAKRLTEIERFRTNSRRSLVATEIQPLDDAQTRFQFYLSAPSNYNVYQMIYDENRVIIVEAFGSSEKRILELHRLIGIPELLTIPSPGNVPATVQAEILAVVAKTQSLIAARKHAEVFLLITSDEMRSQLQEFPDDLHQSVLMFDTFYKPRLIETFEVMDFSKGTYLEAVNTVRFPHPKGDIVWIKSGQRWYMK